MGAGSAVVCALEGFRYRVALYRREFDESLARQHFYDAESNWSTYAHTTPSDEWLTGTFVFDEDCFVRITVQRVDGFQAVRPYRMDEMVVLEQANPPVPPMPDWAQAEVDRVSERVEGIREPGDLVFAVLADIHYATGCIWPQTARNLHAVAKSVHLDAVVQLGDIVEGVAPLDTTLSHVTRVLTDLHSCGSPVYSCVGNHDTNCFSQEGRSLSKRECAQLYLGEDEGYYYVDFDESRLRCIFLDSFELSRKECFGYDWRQVAWFLQVLHKTPRDWKLLVFSHVTPCAEFHYWSETIVNGPLVLRALEARNRACPGSVLAVVHGHGHADQLYSTQSIPFVSIGCAKFSGSENCKPEGSVVPERKLGTASQDLWDVIVVKIREGRLHLVRFGAGEDLIVDAHRLG